MARNSLRDPEIKRMQILNAAVGILTNKVYSQCPINEIAKRAKVAKGTVYLYFKSKEELYFSIVFMLIDRIKTDIAVLQKSDLSPGQKLYSLLERQAAFLEKHINIFMAIKQQLKSHKQKYQLEMEQKIGELVGIIARIIEDGIKIGEFKNYPVAAVAGLYLSVMFANAHHKLIVRNKTVDIYSSPQLLWDIFSKGISK